MIIKIFMRLVSLVSWEWALNLLGKRTEVPYLVQDEIYGVLEDNNRVILVRRSAHLTTYLIGLGHFILTGKFGYWSHTAINLPGSYMSSPRDIIILEATRDGTHPSGFDDLLSADSFAILEPVCCTKEEWDRSLEKAPDYVGRPYDGLFSVSNHDAMSCVEYVLVVVEGIENHREKFKNLYNTINKYGNLTPDMIYECEDFKVTHEYRRKSWRKT